MLDQTDASKMREDEKLPVPDGVKDLELTVGDVFG